MNTVARPRATKGPASQMSIQLKSAPKRRPLSDIKEIAVNASGMLIDVRESMLAPHPRKHPPVFTTTQVAELCHLDRQRMHYLSRTEPDLPQGTLRHSRSREFTLQETRVWIDRVAPYVKRPEGVLGKKIAIGNFKGGVSKTTTAMTLAQGLSLFGRKVLLVDLDPQASLTALNGILADSEVTDEQTVLPLIYGDQTDLEYAVQGTYWDGIHLIPASAALFGAEFFLPFKQSKDQSFQFWNVLNKGLEPLLEYYDVVIIDTPPALSYLTINAFMAADGLIVPTPPSALDYASSTQFWNLFADLSESMQQVAPALQKSFDFIHVLLAKVDQSQAATPIVRDWINKTYEGLVLPIEIPTTAVTQSAAAEFGTVYDISRYQGSLKTYQRAREAYDRFSEIVDQQLVSLWQAEQEGE
ncbi:Chromosome partitioning protein [Paraburkholderia unamae]|uniref:ParA family protein n=1 Tax=Paraburkholderia unamae TaxID=219649 RepID=UPI000DC25D5C|nr:AAA family ATPase [Paraburkholderia unamae]RAR54231.1 chromosome partitioning protein [Paraburkholderia unamae]CAG9272524.1 Chromosome partitioning protein [Paraburkholderia unamae]